MTFAFAVPPGVAPAWDAVVLRGGVVVHASRGGEEDGARGPAPSLFDVASLTKVIATGTLAALLVKEGRIGLDVPAAEWLPRFRGGGKERVTVRQLLAHSSGLPWWRPWFERAIGLQPDHAWALGGLVECLGPLGREADLRSRVARWQADPRAGTLHALSLARGWLGDLAGAYRQQFPALRLAAITGSSGKTIVKEMLAAILGRREGILESRGNHNNDLGLPLTLLRLTSKFKLGVVELGMNAPGEIRRLAKLAKPAVGIITNIGDAHLGRFRSKQALVAAKLELLAELPADGMAVLNADDPYLVKASRKLKRVLTFGRSPQAQVRIGEVAVLLSGTHVSLAWEGEKQHVRLGVLGAHQAWNAAAAVAGALALGQAFKMACRALEGFHQKTPMRLELLRIGQHRVLNDAYNSNPQSAAKALELLAVSMPISASRKR